MQPNRIQLTLLACVITGLSSPALAQQPQTCFFEGPQFAGASMCVAPGNTTRMPRGWNDRARSVKVATGYALQAFVHNNYGGNRVTVQGDFADLAVVRMSGNLSSYRHVSSTSPEARDPATEALIAADAARAKLVAAADAQVCLFEQEQFGGASLCLSAGELTSMPRGWNDRARSARVQAGHQMVGFVHNNYRGHSSTLVGEIPRLAALGLNRNLSSLKISVNEGQTMPSTVPSMPPWYTVATEGASIAVSGSGQYRYGDGSSWHYRGFSWLGDRPVQCTAAFFGRDPAPGQPKVCQLLAREGDPGLVVAQPTPAPIPTPTPTPVPPAAAALIGIPGTTVSSQWTAQHQDAARLLIQATYGPTRAEIDRVAAMGPTRWLDEQFATAPMDSHWAYVMIRNGPIGCITCDSAHINAVMESFWTQAITGPDQLRQRMVFALSQIFVVSTVNSAVSIQKDAHSAYLDMLSRNAFGNFRQLIEEVSLHPTMAHYLSHMRNQKEDPATGKIPDENYAREVMQLFTIGLWQLNPDGSRKLDANGRPIPAYGQEDVMGLAKVFTGLSWGNGDTSESGWRGWSGRHGAWNHPLQFYPQYHSTSEKRFLGTTVAANTAGPISLKMALDTLFNHPNVGPFIGKQLIQRLVTSNPSPAYVQRVAAAFDNNGQGVRGDMQAVIRAILLDPEARGASPLTSDSWGKMREPMLRLGHWLRGFEARAESGYYRIWNLENPVSSLGQNPLRAPSVFNWYRPHYSPPGLISTRGMVAPEFEITHETTTTGYANFVVNVVERGLGHNTNVLRPDYSALTALAGTPEALVQLVNEKLVAGMLSRESFQIVVGAVQAVPASNPLRRAQTAVALTLLSPEFIIQR